MSAPRPSEVNLGRAVVRYFAGLGFDVFREVGVKGLFVDVVAVRGPEVHAVECKVTAGLDVADQALAHLRWSSHAWIAAPRRASPFLHLGLDRAGIGWLAVWRAEQYPEERWDVSWVEVAPAMRRRFLPTLRAACRPEHRPDGGWADAGAMMTRGSRFTPFAATCRAIARVVSVRPGISLKEAVEAIEHHYGSDNAARGALRQWLDRGRVPGVTMKREGRRLHLFPEDQ